MARKSRAKPPSPFRGFNSSPEAIRLVVLTYVKLNGEMVYLSRAVDHEGEILECCAGRTRDEAAALTFMKKALKRHGSLAEITTDGRRSYGAAMGALGNRDKRRIGRHLNPFGSFPDRGAIASS